MIKKEIKKGVLVYAPINKPEKPRTEKAHQMDLIALIRFYFPKESALLFHPVNEGKHTAFHRTQQKKEGLLSGVSDIICLWQGKEHHCFICELKKPGATFSAVKSAQREFIQLSEQQGAFSCVAFGAAAGWAAWLDFVGISKDSELRTKADKITN